jgi:hypothetical protein
MLAIFSDLESRGRVRGEMRGGGGAPYQPFKKGPVQVTLHGRLRENRGRQLLRVSCHDDAFCTPHLHRKIEMSDFELAQYNYFVRTWQ